MRYSLVDPWALIVSLSMCIAAGQRINDKNGNGRDSGRDGERESGMDGRRESRRDVE